jgi:hypothetical protein
VDIHATDLIGINGITRVLLAYTCQQGVYPRGHVLPLQLLISYIKSKSVPLHAMEALGGRGSTAPTHSRPRHSMVGELSASRPGRALPPGKGPPVPIGYEAGWTPEPVWTQRREEKSFAPAEDRTPITRSSSP